VLQEEVSAVFVGDALAMVDIVGRASVRFTPRGDGGDGGGGDDDGSPWTFRAELRAPIPSSADDAITPWMERFKTAPDSDSRPRTPGVRATTTSPTIDDLRSETPERRSLIKRLRVDVDRAVYAPPDATTARPACDPAMRYELRRMNATSLAMCAAEDLVPLPPVRASTWHGRVFGEGGESHAIAVEMSLTPTPSSHDGGDDDGDDDGLVVFCVAHLEGDGSWRGDATVQVLKASPGGGAFFPELGCFAWRARLRRGDRAPFKARLQYRTFTSTDGGISDDDEREDALDRNHEPGLTLHFTSSPTAGTVSGMDVVPATAPAPWRGFASGVYAALPMPEVEPSSGGSPTARRALTRSAALKRVRRWRDVAAAALDGLATRDASDAAVAGASSVGAREEEEEEEDVAIAREDGAWGDVGVLFDGSGREYERAEARAPVMDLLL